jgi:hypothetical protein
MRQVIRLQVVKQGKAAQPKKYAQHKKINPPNFRLTKRFFFLETINTPELTASLGGLISEDHHEKKFC